MSNLILLPDQQELVGKVSTAMRSPKRSILLQSPTGSGKTAMGTYMIIKAVEKIKTSPHLAHKKLIFTLPRKDLLEQTSNTLRRYGIDHSFIAAGKPYNPFAKVMLGMVETMANWQELGKLPPGFIVFMDETQYGADAVGTVINHYKAEGAWVIGLSATPWRSDGVGLGIWYDQMVEGKSIKWLIDNKRLSDYDYFYGKTKLDTSKVPVRNGQFVDKHAADFMESQGMVIGDCVNDYKLRCMGKLHLVRCASIRHSEMIAASFRASGIPAMHVDGKTENRAEIFKAFALRELLVLTFARLLTFGFDLSQASGMDVCVESGSDMRLCNSLADQMQWWGRMMRYKPYPAIFNDHVNNHVEHQLPCSDRKWQLEDRRRRKGMREPVPPTRQCPQCRLVHPPAPICNQCGHVYVVEGRVIKEVEGELVKADKETMRQMKVDARRKQAMCKTLDELVKHGKEMGYGNPVAWAKKVFEGRKTNRNQGDHA